VVVDTRPEEPQERPEATVVVQPPQAVTERRIAAAVVAVLAARMELLAATAVRVVSSYVG
jgi:hypothetical protein